MSEMKQYLINALDQGIRFDGRKPTEYRKVSVEYGISETADGSARVKIGDTEVLAGVKMEIGKPYPDTPDEGALMVGAELIPMANPDFEAGPPSIQAIELARVVDRGIREAKAIDTKKLCVKEGEKVWTVSIDIIPINDAGNLLDAAGLAALAALKDAKFPEFDGESIDHRAHTNKKLPIVKEPIPITVLKVGNHFIVDPVSEEEKSYDARLTVASISDDVICALQKGGDSPITIEDVDKMVDIALDKAKEMRKAL